MFYQKRSDGSVQCAICPHRCVIQPTHRGICGVRENRQGTLYALNFGKTIAAAIDPIEKKPLYHFMPGTKIYSFATVGCNLRCSWCQNWDISQSSKPNRPIEGYDVSPEDHVKRAIQYHCPSIAYTYSEPTIFLEYALQTMRLAHEKGLKNVWVTNGFMTQETLNEIIPFLDAANVDYKGPSDGVYETYCGASAQPVMETMKSMLKAGVHLEITTLLVPGVNDSPLQLETISKEIYQQLGPNVPWHISRFFPAWKMNDLPITPLKTMELARDIGYQTGIRIIHLGNV